MSPARPSRAKMDQARSPLGPTTTSRRLATRKALRKLNPDGSAATKSGRSKRRKGSRTSKSWRRKGRSKAKRKVTKNHQELLQGKVRLLCRHNRRVNLRSLWNRQSQWSREAQRASKVKRSVDAKRRTKVKAKFWHPTSRSIKFVTSRPLIKSHQFKRASFKEDLANMNCNLHQQLTKVKLRKKRNR